MSDDTFIFKESPMKLIRRLLWAGAFVAMGVFLLLHGDTEGWYAVGFFGLCALVLILRLIRGGIILKADSSGIKIKTLYGLKKFNWSDVNGFYVRNIHDAKMIHIEYSDSFNKMKAGSKIKSIINGGGLVFSDDFDCSAEDICSILNECKKKWETIPDNFL